MMPHRTSESRTGHLPVGNGVNGSFIGCHEWQPTPPFLKPRAIRLSKRQLTKAVTRSNRRGAVMVETVLVLSVFLLLILGTFDLGIATYRYNTLSQAARQGSRQAAVHGALAPPAMTAWGPNTYSGTAGDGSVYAQAVSPMLSGFTLTNVTIKLDWIDGGNALQQRVRYTVTTTFKPIIASYFTSSSYTLSAASTMPIAH